MPVVMNRKRKKYANIKEIMLNYILDNSKKYILVTLIFIVGIFAGVIIVNNSSQDTNSQIANCITEFINSFKMTQEIDSGDLMILSIKRNVIIALFLWFAGTTVIGIPVVFLLIFYRGLSLGYTISAFTCVLGTGKGILFSIVALCLQNVLFIPAILTIGVSSIKLYKSILKDRRKENIKLEIFKHTIISCIMLGVLILASFIEYGISFNILQKTISIL